MATKYWVGTTDKTWGTAGNWSPSGIPTNSDDVIISGKYATQGIDGATVTGPLSVSVDDSYTFNIGSSGTALEFAAMTADMTRLEYRGTGNAWFLVDDGDNIDDVIVSTSSYNTNAFSIDCDATGDVDTFTILRGHATLQSGFAATTANVGFSISSAADAILTVEASVTVTNWRLVGGQTNSASGFTGTMVMANGATLEITDGDIGTVYVVGTNTTLQWSANSGTATAIEILPGAIFDAVNSAAKTYTNVSVFPGGTFDASQPGAASASTFSNNPLLYGSALFLDDGSVTVTRI